MVLRDASASKNIIFFAKTLNNNIFLSRKFMITHLSIAFEDLLGSSIAPQVMPHCRPETALNAVVGWILVSVLLVLCKNPLELAHKVADCAKGSVTRFRYSFFEVLTTYLGRKSYKRI